MKWIWKQSQWGFYLNGLATIQSKRFEFHFPAQEGTVIIFMYSKDPLITIFTFHWMMGWVYTPRQLLNFFQYHHGGLLDDMLSSFAGDDPGRLRVGRRSTKKSGSLGQQGASVKGEGRSQFRRAEGVFSCFLFENISGDILGGLICGGINEEGKGSGLDMMWLCYKMIVPPKRSFGLLCVM